MGIYQETTKQSSLIIRCFMPERWTPYIKTTKLNSQEILVNLTKLLYLSRWIKCEHKYRTQQHYKVYLSYDRSSNQNVKHVFYSSFSSFPSQFLFSTNHCEIVLGSWTLPYSDKVSDVKYIWLDKLLKINSSLPL